MKAKGFTLLELMASLSLVILLMGFGIPGLSNLLEDTRAKSAMQSAMRTFNLARSTAVERQQIITLCGSNDGETCSRQWGKYLLVFRDEDDSRTAETEELIVRQELGFADSPFLTRLGWGRSFTQIQRDGSVNLQGSIVYCRSESPYAARRITWNMVGRPYMARDRDGDGLVDDTNGRAINC